MSIATEISRIQADRNTIRAKLVELGMATNTDNLDVLAIVIDNMINHGAVSVEIKEGTTYTIPKGYHNGSGVIRAITDTEGEAEIYKTQAKTITPTKNQQNITPDTGYYALESVTVNAIPDAYQDVTSVTATAGDVLVGKIIVAKDGTVLTGTMTNNGKVTKTLNTSATSYTIAKGYHDGTGTVTISLETKTVTPTKSTQNITPSNGKVLSKVTVNPIPAQYIDASPATAVTENVLDGMTVALPVKDSNGTVTGAEIVEGTMPNIGAQNETLNTSTTAVSIGKGYHDGTGKVNIILEEKSATPTKSTQTISPASGKVLSKVIVNPIPAAYQDITGTTATADEVLYRQQFVGADGVVTTGTMPNIGNVTKTLDTTTKSYTIDKGYHYGDGTVSITTEEKSVTPTKSAQNITPASGKVLSKVSVAAIPAKYQDVTSVDAGAGDVLSGKKIVSSTGEVVTGSMPNNGATTETIDGLTTTSVEIPAGYTSGGSVSLTSDIEEALAAI